jgi:flagellar operon protein (TIGR03826 family)
MDLKNCKKCGRMFSDTNGHEICRKCRLEVEDHFKIVREYIYDHPGTTVNEVAEETGVPKKEILKYLREERLELVNDNDDLKCQKCGKPINSGRYCVNCAAELKKGFDKAMKEDEAKETPKDKSWHTGRK